MLLLLLTYRPDMFLASLSAHGRRGSLSIHRCATKKTRMKSGRLLLLFAILLLCLVKPAHAADINAASCSLTDVQAAIDAAVSGDRVLVPTCTTTWSSPIAFPATKDIEIIGAGIGNTVLTCTAADGTCFVFKLEAESRLSGFTLISANKNIRMNGNQNLTKFFRIDHNRIVSTTGYTALSIIGGDDNVHPQGLIDNNEFVDIAFAIFGTNDNHHVLWAQETPLGNNSQIVYIEDNLYESTSGNINFVDANQGGRYVWRFNTTIGKGYAEFHSVQGENRAAQRFEIYKNNQSNPSGFSGLTFLRAGSGVVFGNRQAAGPWSFGVAMDNVRSEESVNVAGQCNGSSGWDENQPGQSGYRCRDQIGISHDATQWWHLPPAPYNQVSQPVYFWDNLRDGSPMDTDVQPFGLDQLHIQPNRDFYNTVSPFDGTTGVGEGPIADRPATCTTGVAYWATDEGEWNSRQTGPDGRLYKCTATNTWTLYYTPFTYPHPLQAGAVVRPAPPTNLNAVVR